MTDYEMILRIKNDEEGYLDLWNKYLPLVKSRAFRFCSKSYNNGLTEDDYVQDAYFAFLKAIDFIDLSNIKCAKEKFRFSVPLKHSLTTDIERKVFLKKYRGIQSAAYREEDVSIDGHPKSVTGNSILNPDEYHKYDQASVLKEPIDIIEVQEQMLENRDSEDAAILRMRQEGRSNREISESLGISYHRVVRKVQFMKKECGAIIHEIMQSQAV